jgi:hypothetical protein
MDTVTIVSGLPRSGTSLMMQMLEAGGMPLLTDGVRRPDESNVRGYYEYEPVKRTHMDAAWVADAVGRAVKVIHLLLPHLPDACAYRVVFMKRDLDEVVRSQAVMLERAEKRGARLSDDQLRAIYASQYEKTDAWLRDRPNISAHTVSYNDLIATPEPVIEALVAFLGGGLDAAAMRAAIDPDLYRRRAPRP